MNARQRARGGRTPLYPVLGAVALLAALVAIMIAGAWAAWDVNKPAGTDLVSTVDDTIRLDKQTLLNAIGYEHQFTSSDTTGYHLEGSARIYVGPDADKSLAKQDEGRIYFGTDTNTLYYGEPTQGNWTQLSPIRNTEQLTISWSTEAPSTTSTTFVDIDATGYGDTITTTGGDVLVTFTVTVDNTSADETVYFNLAINDTPVTSADNGLGAIYPQHSGDTAVGTITITRRTTTPPTAGSVKVEPMWRVSGGEAHVRTVISHTIFSQEL